MTRKEYLMKMLSRFNVSEDDVDLIMINQNISIDGEINVKDLKTAIYNEFTQFLPLANISEGGLSINWNMETLKLYYSQLAKELGLEDLLNDRQNSVSDASYLM